MPGFEGYTATTSLTDDDLFIVLDNPAGTKLTKNITALNAKGYFLTSLANPTNAQDAATKAYVDAIATGLDVKASVRAATTTAGTLASSFANGSVIDGVTLATGNRILIKNQAAGAENGIYTVNASGAPTRATDADTSAEVTAGMFTFIEEGTALADTGWVLTTNNPITLGTTALSFTQFSGGGGGGATNLDGLTDVAITSPATGHILRHDGTQFVNALGTSFFETAGTAVLKSTGTTKGDLLAASAVSTITRLPVGTNGQVLSANSAQTTGLQWVTPTSGSGAVTNVRIAGSLVGDGVTNDAVALQAVIDASSIGDTLFFDRLFGVSASIRFKAGRKYLGSNKDTTGLRQINGANLDYVVCDDGWFNNATTASKPWTIEDLKIDINKTNQTSGTGIGLICMNFWAVHRSMQLTDYKTAGIKVVTQNRAGTTITDQVSEPRFWECQFRGNGLGDGIWQNDPSLAKCADGWVLGCAFAGGLNGLNLEAAAGWKIAENHFYAQRGSAIYAVGAYATTVTGNYIEGWGLDMTAVTEKYAIGLKFANGPWPSTITGNVCTGPGNGTTQSGTVRGIMFYGVSGAATKVAIAGNTVYGANDAGSAGIWVSSQGGGGVVLVSGLNSNLVVNWATLFVTDSSADMVSFPAGGTWAAATGTATRTTFDTATVTLAQLAQRVKALIDDLGTTKGLLD